MGGNETPLLGKLVLPISGCFLVRLTGGSFLRPGLTTRKASRAAAVKDGRRLPRACAARSVLDGGEHGARLEQDWTRARIYHA